MNFEEEKNLAGACGLYCGLCPRYQSKAPSRCIGCQLGENHNYCSVWRCAVKKHGLVTCAQCEEFPCDKLVHLLGVQPDGTTCDSFLTHRPAIPNLKLQRELGMEGWLGQQHPRRLLAEELIENYNDGRSMTFYCTACALMPLALIENAMGRMKKGGGGGPAEMKTLIRDAAAKANIDLKLRKKIS
ncbi:DUF3795 domain-containing protein [candidate division KSB1 bacterium]|nr:DUF3795 domain-containing protein [candidate division KSB1 bacterium]